MRQWSKLLRAPFYPGYKNRDKVDCPALPSTPLNIVSQEESEKSDREKRAWDRYFAGKGPKPSATE